MGKTQRSFIALGLACMIIFISLITARLIKTVQFDKNCTQYLKRAADASTVELALDELNKAIRYAETNNLTSGYVSIFIQQPTNDIGYWYKNMVACRDELKAIPEDATVLERSNLLMKVRESLTDNGKNGVSITCPAGLDVYPDNKPYFWVTTISFFLMSIFYSMAFIAWYHDWD